MKYPILFFNLLVILTPTLKYLLFVFEKNVHVYTKKIIGYNTSRNSCPSDLTIIVSQ